MLTLALFSNESVPRSKSYMSIGSEHDPGSYGKNGATTAMDGDTPRGAHYVDHPGLLTLRYHDGSSGLEMLLAKLLRLLCVKTTPDISRKICPRPRSSLQDISCGKSLYSGLDLAMKPIRAT